MRLLRTSSLILITTVSIEYSPRAKAEDLTTFGHFGYQVTEIEDEPAGGFDLTGGLQTSVKSLSSGIPVMIGGGPRLVTLKYPVDDVDVDLKILSLQFMTGIKFPVTDKVTAVTTIAYEIGVKGEVKWSGRGESVKKSVDELRRLNHGWTFLWTINEKLSAGPGVTWYSGRIKASDVPDDLDFVGYAWQINAAYSLEH